MINSKSLFEQLFNEINEKEKVKNELKYLKTNILDCVKSNDYKNLIDFLIPLNKNWKNDSPQKCYLETEQGRTITVTASSTYGDYDNHHPYNLFNGKFDLNGDRWGTKNGVTNPFISIEFNYAVVVNTILITSRNGGNSREAPKNFELFGFDTENQSFVSLFVKNEISWNQNERKYFYFDNEKSFKSYKINFYVNNYIVSIAELNLIKV